MHHNVKTTCLIYQIPTKENHQSPPVPVKNIQFSQISGRVKVFHLYPATFIKLVLGVRRGTDDKVCHFSSNKSKRGEEGKLEEELGEAG